MVTRWDPALDPVRRAVLEAARQDADRAVAQAAEQGRQRHHDAEDSGRRIRDEARARGESQGGLAMSDARRRARARARSVVLVARQEAYQELRTRVVERLAEARQDPSYDALRARLVDRARAVLGPGAEVVDAPGGGIVASTPGRVLDLSFPVLADAVMDSLGSTLEELWGGGGVS